MDLTPVLFTEKNSIYESLNCDCYDIARSAYSYHGSIPVIAHPPCRLWSRLRSFSTADQCEKITAIFAVKTIQQIGGVLEHPMGSSLWKFMDLPMPGCYDKFGGFSICVNQSWFGHPCRKSTMLYIVGLAHEQLPDWSPNFIPPQGSIAVSGNNPFKRKPIKKANRSTTPIDFAKFLIEIQKTILKNKK